MADSLRILLLGSGGREHALVEKILCVPGNGGTANGDAKIENGPQNITMNDFTQLVSFVRAQNINLVVPGSEEPLVQGVGDWLRNEGIPVFGPSMGAARLEGSKCFAKDFMARHAIPTAKHWNCSTIKEAYSCLEKIDFPVVVKASGLAGGKGVLMPSTPEETRAAVETVMVQKAFGNAGAEIGIEEALVGDEISITLVSDGSSVRLFPVGQDVQRVLDGNVGANTGGMGVYAPTPLLSASQIDDITKTILQPMIDGIREEGYPFIGFICVGLMMTSDGPKLLEYNARFGDPESQTLFPLPDERSDLVEVILACLVQHLHEVHLGFVPRYPVSVVIASAGYPERYETGEEIHIVPTSGGALLFHAGTAFDGRTLRTAGGRVLAVTFLHDTLEGAVEEAYEAITHVIRFKGMHFRTDIGKAGIAALD